MTAGAAAGSPPATGRPRRRLTAFLLNLFLPPAGYAYAGAWVAAGMALALLMIAPMTLLEISSEYPPGLYAIGEGGMLAVGGAAALGLAVHAAWFAARSGPATGAPWRQAALCLGLAGAAIGANLLLRAYWPNPTYEATGTTMAPTVEPGDLVLADAARAHCGRGDLKPGQVVVYRRDGASHVQRIVAGPGQLVAMQAGRLWIDGAYVGQAAAGQRRLHDLAIPAAVIRETLPGGAAYQILSLGGDGPYDNLPPRRVPPGSWYVLGDNRGAAADSRVFGPLPGRDICAVATRIVNSKDPRRVGQRL